jgi:hypothetical protein
MEQNAEKLEKYYRKLAAAGIGLIQVGLLHPESK